MLVKCARPGQDYRIQKLALPLFLKTGMLQLRGSFEVCCPGTGTLRLPLPKKFRDAEDGIPTRSIRELHQLRAVRRDLHVKLVAALPEVFLAPKVANRAVAGQLQVGELDRNIC